MRRTLAVVSVTGALFFGGAGVANATATSDLIPTSTTTTVAQQDNDQDNSDKTGLWGLLGLLGLGGLAGLRRRKETYPGAGPAAPGRGGAAPDLAHPEGPRQVLLCRRGLCAPSYAWPPSSGTSAKGVGGTPASACRPGGHPRFRLSTHGRP